MLCFLLCPPFPASLGGAAGLSWQLGTGSGQGNGCRMRRVPNAYIPTSAGGWERALLWLLCDQDTCASVSPAGSWASSQSEEGTGSMCRKRSSKVVAQLCRPPLLA